LRIQWFHPVSLGPFRQCATGCNLTLRRPGSTAP
jgi:hypothetical protein